MRRLVRVLAALAIGAACCVVVFAGSVASATVAAWGSHGDGDAHPVHSPAPYCPPTTRPTTTRPYVRPPYTRPPVTHPPVTKPPVTQPPASRPPVTKPPVTKPPVTEPGSNEQASGPPVTLPPPTVPVAKPTVGAALPAVVADVAPLDTFDTFQAFVKGVAADAARERARARAERASVAVAAVPAPTPIISQLAPPPALLPPGPLFHDSPAPLLPLNASGLRTARSFVFLFGLSALALGFLAVRARLARRSHAFVSAAIDEHGDYVEFV